MLYRCGIRASTVRRGSLSSRSIHPVTYPSPRWSWTRRETHTSVTERVATSGIRLATPPAGRGAMSYLILSRSPRTYTGLPSYTCRPFRVRAQRSDSPSVYLTETFFGFFMIPVASHCSEVMIGGVPVCHQMWTSHPFPWAMHMIITSSAIATVRAMSLKWFMAMLNFFRSLINVWWIIIGPMRPFTIFHIHTGTSSAPWRSARMV